MYDYGFRDYSPVRGRFTTVDPIRDGSNWFSYVVNDPVRFRDPWGLSVTDTSWWSKAKDTVKGWGESIKSDLSQTWNEIKDVALTAFTNTQTAVSNFISNTQSNFSKWGEQAKADFKATEKQIKNKVRNYIKDKIGEVTTYKMINETVDPFFSFSENDINPDNSDGGINLITKQGYKISDGWSVTITSTGEIDENGSTVYNYEPKNEVPKNHPILRWIVDKTFELKEFNGIEDWNNSQEGYWLDLPSYKKALKIFNQQGNLK